MLEPRTYGQREVKRVYVCECVCVGGSGRLSGARVTEGGRGQRKRDRRLGRKRESKR